MHLAKSWKEYTESVADLFDCYGDEVKELATIIVVVAWLIVVTIPALLGVVPEPIEEKDDVNKAD